MLRILFFESVFCFMMLGYKGWRIVRQAEGGKGGSCGGQAIGRQSGRGAAEQPVREDREQQSRQMAAFVGVVVPLPWQLLSNVDVSEMSSCCFCSQP